ncbi:hypothetical protein CW304_18885 [Bacillus sp. UFRGS-B20]|nr:hypothetical protein CW304_18885 [Bacillus sp. UFRGS-B20]
MLKIKSVMHTYYLLCIFPFSLFSYPLMLIIVIRIKSPIFRRKIHNRPLNKQMVFPQMHINLIHLDHLRLSPTFRL